MILIPIYIGGKWREEGLRETQAVWPGSEHGQWSLCSAPPRRTTFGLAWEGGLDLIKHNIIVSIDQL